MTHNSPKIYANSTRLTLRHLCLSDVPHVHRHLSDFDVTKWLSTFPHPLPDDFAEKYVMNQPDADNKFAFAIIENESLMFIGIVSYRHREDGKIGIGYWLGKDHWNRGYATEAARLMIDYLYKTFGDQIEIVSRHKTDNAASANVLKKVGFEYTDERPMIVSLARQCLIEVKMMKLDRNDYLRAAKLNSTQYSE